jgi:hypothetical protein
VPHLSWKRALVSLENIPDVLMFMKLGLGRVNLVALVRAGPKFENANSSNGPTTQPRRPRRF